MARPMPRQAHMKGDVSVRNLRAKTETKCSITSIQLTVTKWDDAAIPVVNHNNGASGPTSTLFLHGKETETFHNHWAIVNNYLLKYILK